MTKNPNITKENFEIWLSKQKEKRKINVSDHHACLGVLFLREGLDIDVKCFGVSSGETDDGKIIGGPDWFRDFILRLLQLGEGKTWTIKEIRARWEEFVKQSIG